MTQAITTSIRLPQQIRRELERVSHRLHKGKNGVILDALRDYFDKIEKTSLKQEARRQSVLASNGDQKESFLWEENADFDDWKS